MTMQLKCGTSTVRLLLSGFASMLFLVSGCTENATVPTYSSSPLTPEVKSRIAGKIASSGAGVKVYLEQGRPVDSTMSDATDGYFFFENLQAGSYRFRVAGEGYDTFSTMIKIDEHYSYELGTIFLAPLRNNNLDTIPSVYDHYPATGSDVVYLPPDKYQNGSGRLIVSVSFDRPMDRQSVEAAFSIDPPVTGGYFKWFQNMQTYSSPQIIATSKSTDNSAVFFEVRAAAQLDSVSSTSMSVPSAQISTFNVMKSFTFYLPRSECFTDTTYTIKIARSAVDTSGTPLDTALEFTFKTVQAAVSYNDIEMLPNNGDDWVPLISNGIQLTFPRRMNEELTGKAISVNLADKPVFLWKNYNLVTLFTGGLFVPDTTYRITIAATAVDIEGNPLLSENKTLTFSTAPIKIEQTQPARGTIGVNVATPVTITFNTYMDRTSIPSKFACIADDGDTVDGAINYSYYAMYNSTTHLYDTTFNMNQIVFTQSTRLKNNSLYTVYVGSGVSDLNGYAMKEDYKLQFITMP